MNLEGEPGDFLQGQKGGASIPGIGFPSEKGGREKVLRI